MRFPPRARASTAVLGVFLFTFLMITREGMETALMLMQVKDPNLISGAVLGLAAAIAVCLGWAKFGHLINVKRSLGDWDLSAALHGPGEHLFFPRVCRGGFAAEQRIPS